MEPNTIKERSGFIGGTDAGVIAGVNPYKTALELFLEKRGEVPAEDISDKEAIIWGNVLEDVIAQEYSRRTGYDVRRVNKKLTHPVHDFIGGHIDRDILKTDRALEVKTAGTFMAKDWGPAGSDEVPEHYYLQCQHYMSCLPKVNVFDLAVLVGGQDFRIYHIHRDEAMIKTLEDLIVDFWRRVQENDAPDLEFDHRSAKDLLKKMYPGTNAEVVKLSGEAEHWHKVAVEAADKAKQYKAVSDGAKLHLMAMIEDNAVGLIEGVGGYTRKIVKRKGYTVEDTEVLDFRFSKNPKGVK